MGDAESVGGKEGSRFDACLVEGDTYMFTKGTVDQALTSALLENRRRVQARLVLEAVERAHELALEQRKIETLGRLEQLSSPRVSVSSFAINDNDITNTQDVTNE